MAKPISGMESGSTESNLFPDLRADSSDAAKAHAVFSAQHLINQADSLYLKDSCEEGVIIGDVLDLDEL